MYRIYPTGPADLFKQLLTIKTHSENTPVAICFDQSYMDAYEALAYHDAIKYFHKEGRGLKLELWLMQTVRTPALIVAAAFNKDKRYCSKQSYLMWESFDEILWGTIEDMRDRKESLEQVKDNVERILDDAFDIDMGEVKDLAEDSEMWKFEDLESNAGFQPIEKSDNYLTEFSKPLDKYEPILVLEGSVTTRRLGDLIRQLDTYNMAGVKNAVLLINSPGGSVTAAFAFMDAMDRFEGEITTISIGMSMSAGGLLLSQGTKGKRTAMSNSQIMIHQARGAVDDNGLENYEYLNDIMIQRIAEATGKSIDEITQVISKDAFFSPEEAIEFGLIDSYME